MRIGIIGDYDLNLRTHKATDAAFRHAGEKLSLPLEVRWLPTAAIEGLGECDGLFAAAGTPYVSMPGALKAIEFARTGKRPLLATCGGFPHARIYIAPNVLGLPHAHSARHR